MTVKTQPRNFYEVYAWNISPKLKEIDLFLKTCEESISISGAAEVMGITLEEAEILMEKADVSKLSRRNFMRVMRSGSSDICQYLDRELECGSPFTYTQEEVAYIYGLDINDVSRACRITGIREATEFTLPRLFYHIPVA